MSKRALKSRRTRQIQVVLVKVFLLQAKENNSSIWKEVEMCCKDASMSYRAQRCSYLAIERDYDQEMENHKGHIFVLFSVLSLLNYFSLLFVLSVDWVSQIPPATVE